MMKIRWFLILFIMFTSSFNIFAQIDKDKCNIYFNTRDAILKDDKYYVKVFIRNNLGFGSETELLNRINNYGGVLGSKLAITPGDAGFKELRLIFNEKKADQFFEDMLIAFDVPVIRVNNVYIASNQLTEFLSSQSKK